ncbi:MAG TPA: acetyl-CoA carboxylase biotin carboxyl carrier protein subunit [Fimbriimonas sp.]|nr:acetyl-CoA carboxylase biotin carboxyl carrier protein subunit [Fimbriimonas sp.]
MSDNKATITELAELMQEFRLNDASLTLDELTISFSRRTIVARHENGEEGAQVFEQSSFAPEAAKPEPPKGTPITSPMTGIFYCSPSPSAPSFVKEGEEITAGQIVGLIEAMKVFNEIPSPLNGVVLKLVAQSGQLVQPGDVLLLIE